MTGLREAWEKLDEPWQLAFNQAWIAYQNDCCPAGTVILDAAGAIVAQANNRVRTIDTNARELADTSLAHAAINALTQIPTVTQHVPDALYSTIEPCLMCMGAIVINGLRRLHFATADFFAGATSLNQSYPPAVELWPKLDGPHSGPISSIFQCLYVAFHAWITPDGPVARAYSTNRADLYKRSQAVAEIVEPYKRSKGTALKEVFSSLPETILSR
ncbi:hypothetical protein GCM10009557_00740 [Virgisporangium ochraceum]|uniref:CMP/dCMP-type deaminase domain-containing protein n=1 Tax=Virgisporangium ochraceum TaxID=65505 RepID=A0A8J4A777_9ACTN|nr:hypothetical protein Voc01_090230 [Virgisporangium ochraceum]